MGSYLEREGIANARYELPLHEWTTTGFAAGCDDDPRIFRVVVYRSHRNLQTGKARPIEALEGRQQNAGPLGGRPGMA